MIEIPVTKRLEPYFKIAENEAHKSPCIRRQYGAVLTANADDDWYAVSYNVRVSPCCNGNLCARDNVNTRHGGSVEVGGEIHAETSVLIASPIREGYFILVGFEKGHELLGENVYPCHSCAMAIKFAGYTHIYIKDKNKLIVPVSISDVIEYRIQQWEPLD